jgi:hypothetical protein
MSVQPMPIPVRAFGGEGVDTYCRRLASRNHTDSGLVELALRQRGLLSGRSTDCSGRLKVWRQLGRLHQTTFTTPTEKDGSYIADRDLCRRCCQGLRAHGRLPHVGMVCIRHRWWIGAHQRDVRPFPESLKAERHFRTHLAPKGIYFDAFAMQLGIDCAAASIAPSVLSERRRKTGISDLTILLYPEQVALARLFVRRNFLDVVADPDTAGTTLHATIHSAVSDILPPSADGQTWRAVARIRRVARGLSWQVTRGRRHARKPENDAYELLRFSSFLV